MASTGLARLPPVAFPTRTTMLTVITQILRLAPTAGKLLAVLLLLLNAGSWPLVWHVRVLSCLAEWLVARSGVILRHAFSGRVKRAAALEKWYESRMPVGVHPFRAVWTYKNRATPDDCDFLLHLSNSSYPKALDRARMRMALNTFPNFLRCGGWAPLAATHFHFIREIPMFARYEVRASVGAWDDKWIWVVSRFVGPASNKSNKSKSKSRSDKSGTPSEVPTPAIDEVMASDPTAQALLARAVAQTEPDGAVLYCTSVSSLCYKLGRRTVPPAVVLAANGFSAPLELFNSNSEPIADSTSAQSADSAAPTPAPADLAYIHLPYPIPAHWPRTAALRASIPALTAFYAGGWREDRWWEEALAGCEVERRERVGVFGAVRSGMEGVRGV
ncbi:hypothetical protein FB451DRAFT_1136520 [Mycena latifolia]|nr:hypothetical protein FB451DRAFT_1136520 [Mycena latifolia]